MAIPNDDLTQQTWHEEELVNVSSEGEGSGTQLQGAEASGPMAIGSDGPALAHTVSYLVSFCAHVTRRLHALQRAMARLRRSLATLSERLAVVEAELEARTALVQVLIAAQHSRNGMSVVNIPALPI